MQGLEATHMGDHAAATCAGQQQRVGSAIAARFGAHPAVLARRDLEKAAPYAQPTVDGLTVRSEAVSNRYLDPMFWLDHDRVGQLVTLGWQPPTAEDTENFWRDDELPTDAGELAGLLVVTLREIYGLPAPSFLVTSGFGGSGPLEADKLPFGLTVAEPESTTIDRR